MFLVEMVLFVPEGCKLSTIGEGACAISHIGTGETRSLAVVAIDGRT